MSEDDRERGSGTALVTPVGGVEYTPGACTLTTENRRVINRVIGVAPVEPADSRLSGAGECTSQNNDATPTAVILAAGEGSRLRSKLNGQAKPEFTLLGLSLAERTLAACNQAGVNRFIVVLGHRAEDVRAHFQSAASRRGCSVDFITADNWGRGNGASALAAAGMVDHTPFLLLMSDHIVAPSLITRVLQSGVLDGEVALAVDRNVDAIPDPDDVTKVVADGARVRQIGKQLERWNATDTGVFLCTRGLFEGLRCAGDRGLHTLSDGVRELAKLGRVTAVDVTGQLWVDVDSPETASFAGMRLRSSLVKDSADGYVSRYLNRPISTRLSSWLARFSVSPNQMTLMSFFMCLLGAFLIAQGDYLTRLLGALAVQAASILDGCDGELARLKFLQSKRGAWLDTLLDRYADAAVAVAMTIAAAADGTLMPWIIGMAALLGFMLPSYATKEFELRFRHPCRKTVVSGLGGRDLRLLALSVGVVLDFPLVALAAVGLWSHICVVAILITGWKDMQLARYQGTRD